MFRERMLNCTFIGWVLLYETGSLSSSNNIQYGFAKQSTENLGQWVSLGHGVIDMFLPKIVVAAQDLHTGSQLQ